jgi:hypothetical protein
VGFAGRSKHAAFDAIAMKTNKIPEHIYTYMSLGKWPIQLWPSLSGESGRQRLIYSSGKVAVRGSSIHQ